MRRGSCCTASSQLSRRRKWQASRCCITFSQLYLCDRESATLHIIFFFLFRRYSRRDLVGRLSSLPNGAKFKYKYEFELLNLAWQLFLRIIITNSCINNRSSTARIHCYLNLNCEWLRSGILQRRTLQFVQNR